MTVREWFRTEIGRAPNVYAVLLILAVAFVAYSNSLDAGFHYDDEHHIEANPYLRDLGYVPHFFARPDMFSALPGHDMYRPLLLTTFALNYHLGGYDPLIWRLTAIALHAVCAVGVFLTCLVLSRQLNARAATGTTGALVAALFFALHPVFSETVNYASARSSLLATLCVIWAFLLHRLACDRRPRPARVALWTGSLLLFGLGLLSKEIAIVFPALLALVAILERRHFATVLPAIVLALVVLYVRQMVLGAAVVDFSARADGLVAADHASGGARPISFNLYTQARVIGAYVMLFFWPVGLCINRFVRVSTTPFDPGVIAGTLVIAGILWSAWRLRRRNPVASLGLMWFLIALAPTSSIIPLNHVMNEHRLFLPGIGVALVAGSLLRPRWWMVPAACTLLALTMHRNEDWRDPLRLWQSATRVSPQSEGSWNSVGVELRRRGHYDAALRAFNKARELDPQSWTATFNTGTLYLQRGRETERYEDLEQAHEWLEASLDVRPNSERSRWFLAETLYSMGRIEQAEKGFGDLAGISPRLYEMTRFPLARIALDRGHEGVARKLYEDALRVGRDPVAAELGLADMALRLGKRDEARRHVASAIRARPRSPEPYLFLARLDRGTPAAVRHLFEAEQRGYQPTAAQRRSLMDRRKP